MDTRKRFEAALAQVRVIQKNPSLLALAALVGHRNETGRSEEAYRMLIEIGAPPATAHAILEGWITGENARLGPVKVSVELEAAVWLASFIPGAARIDFTEALLAAGGLSEIPPQDQGAKATKKGA